MKKWMIALVAGATVFAAVYAAAANFTVSTDSIGAGSQPVSTCLSGGVSSTAYTVAYDSTLKAYKVGTVTVQISSANATACDGKTLKVQLAKTDGSTVGPEKSALIATGTTSYPLDYSASSVKASDVDAVNAFIAG